MELLNVYRAGGPFMNLISFMALLMLSAAIFKTIEIVGRHKSDTRYLDLILLAGSVALALGLLSQIIGIVQALEAIREAGDVSPELIMGGAIVSFYAPIWGFIVFIVSMLFYFSLKEIIKSKS